ncbi:unnamed protein product [Ilex paraguariensis]|uniref:Myb-like domain-containing protein n=1 Tax=Ilex paraguariensis TaxID=185542 RepID=A0ABC8TNG8_9AQUA
MATPSSPPTHQDQDQTSDNLQIQPFCTPSNPNSPKPPLPLQSTTSPTKKITPIPWTHEETINLIQAYQEKWYSLKKGQLKANQWEEVAITVAARCEYDEPSKSATQCRHKIEKLRKRYRSEKQKPYPNSWQYFEFMDRMERGPLPISARPMALIKYEKSDPSDDNEDSDDEDEVDVDYGNDSKRNKARSINHIVNKTGADKKLGNGNPRVLRVLQNPLNWKRKEYLESEGSEEEEEEEEEEDNGAGGRELAAEIRSFVERFVKMENNKIEMMREMERLRMEMENKRMEMILESQRKIVDSIGRAFGSHKKMKMAQES